MFRGGFACLNAVQNMSGKRQRKRKEIESIPEYCSEMNRRLPGKRESLASLTTFNKMRNFAGLLKLVVCTIKQVASNIHVHVISLTNLNFIVVFLSC